MDCYSDALLLLIILLCALVSNVKHYKSLLLLPAAELNTATQKGYLQLNRADWTSTNKDEQEERQQYIKHELVKENIE